MPVPAAYNDLTADREVREHVGWVWYQRKFFVSVRDKYYRHFVRFSSVQYYAVVVSKLNCVNNFHHLRLLVSHRLALFRSFTSYCVSFQKKSIFHEWFQIMKFSTFKKEIISINDRRFYTNHICISALF